MQQEPSTSALQQQLPRRRRRFLLPPDGRAEKAWQGAQSALQEVRSLAHARAGVACPSQETRRVPLLPISVHLDSLPSRPEGELHEHLLYKLGETGWDAKSAASRMAWTLGLPDRDEKALEDELNKQFQPFKRHVVAAERGAPCITDTPVVLPIYVKRGNQAVRDELTINVGALGGVGGSVVLALQLYVSSLCRELKLQLPWYNTLIKHLGAIFTEVSEDIKATGTSELLVPIATVDGRLRPKPSHLPCIEDVDPELDAQERERAKRRDDKLLLRSQQRQEAAQHQDH